MNNKCLQSLRKLNKFYLNKRKVGEKSLIAFNRELNNLNLWNNVYFFANVNKRTEL